MNYEIVPIDKLQPDPEQPRKHIDEESLNEIAVSIKNEGLINPIEVDENFKIVTGELRWKAAKIAGLKEVPVKIIGNLSAQSRFIRQMQENLHQNTMSSLDTAMALDKIRKTLLPTAAVVKKGSGGFRHGTPGIKELHDLLGIPETTISEFLNLLGVSDELKEALKDPSFQRTKVVAIKEAPAQYHKKLEHLVATQKNIPRNMVRHVAAALRTADKYGENGNANKLLNENFEGLTTSEALIKINKIVPSEISRINDPVIAAKVISEKAIEFIGLLDEHPLTSFDDFHRPLVVRDLMAFGACLKRYFKGTGKDMEITQNNLFE